MFDTLIATTLQINTKMMKLELLPNVFHLNHQIQYLNSAKSLDIALGSVSMLI